MKLKSESNSFRAQAADINDLPPEILSDILSYLNRRTHVRSINTGISSSSSSSICTTDSQTNFVRISEANAGSDEDVDSTDEGDLGSGDDTKLRNVAEPVEDNTERKGKWGPRWNEYFPKSYIVSCASVSHRWRQAALPYLFQDVRLTSSESHNGSAQKRGKSLSSFVDFLTGVPVIRPYIRILSIHQLFDKSHKSFMVPVPMEDDAPYELLAFTFSRTFLPNLRVVRLRDVLPNLSIQEIPKADNPTSWNMPLLQHLKINLQGRTSRDGMLSQTRILDLLSLFGEVDQLSLSNVYQRDDLDDPPPRETQSLRVASLRVESVQLSPSSYQALCLSDGQRPLTRLSIAHSREQRYVDPLLRLVGSQLQRVHVKRSFAGINEPYDMGFCTNLQLLSIGVSLYEDGFHVFNHTGWANIADMIHPLLVLSPPTLRRLTLVVEYDEWGNNSVRDARVFRDGKLAMRRLDTALCGLADARLRRSRSRGNGLGPEAADFTLFIQQEGHPAMNFSNEATKSFGEAFPGLHERGALKVI